MSGKLLRSVFVVGGVAILAALGASAVFAGASPGHIGGKPTKLLLAGRGLQRAARVAPGDRIERTVTLRVNGRGSLRIVALRVTTKRKSLLTGRRGGLRLSLERCSRPWKRVGHSSAYKCRGTTTKLLTRVPVLGKRKLKGLVVRRESKARLRLTLTLSSGAGNALQGKTTKLRYRFTAVARS
jgi:hypothetical protein